MRFEAYGATRPQEGRRGNEDAFAVLPAEKRRVQHSDPASPVRKTLERLRAVVVHQPLELPEHPRSGLLRRPGPVRNRPHQRAIEITQPGRLALLLG